MTKKLISKIIFLPILVLIILGSFLPLVFATTHTPTCENGVSSDPKSSYCSLTTIPNAFSPDTAVDPVKVIKNIYGISIGIAAILAVVMIMVAGIKYATVESFGSKTEAKQHLIGAFSGLGLLLASYIILRTINVDLVNINLDLGTPQPGERFKGNPFEALNARQVEIAKAESRKVNDGINEARLLSENRLAAIAAATTARQTADASEKLAKDNPTDATLQAKAATDKAKEDNLAATAEVAKKKEAIKIAIISANVALKQLTNAVANGGDTTALANIRANANVAINQQLAKANQAGASPEEIKPIVASGIILNAIFDQTKKGKKFIDDFEPAEIFKRKSGEVINFPLEEKKILETRQKMVSDYKENLTAIQAQDPKQVANFKNLSLTELNNFDLNLGKKLRCPGAIAVTSTEVTCKT